VDRRRSRRARYARQFPGAISSSQTITLDSAYTAGSLTFNNINRYTLAGTGSLTMATGYGSAAINIATGSHMINASMVLANDTVVHATGALTLAGTSAAPARSARMAPVCWRWAHRRTSVACR